MYLQFNRSVLTVYNAIGIPIESKTIDFVPNTAVMNKTGVIVASNEYVYYWQLKKSTSSTMAALNAIYKRDSKERGFHIDDIKMIGTSDTDKETDFKETRTTTDPIQSICANEESLYICKESGELLQMTLPSLTLENKFSSEPSHYLRLNVNGSLLSSINANGILRIMQVKGGICIILFFERKDVWDIVWSKDDPFAFGVMEKNKLVLVYDFEAQEPVPVNGCT